ncbi:MAG: esterase family protein [Actinomycetota bacterium]
MREYVKNWSPALGRDMELLVFGGGGLPVLIFPTSEGRFYQWEDFGMVDALRDRTDAGFIQLWCVDSVDSESWYDRGRSPQQRVERHLDYERYLVEELIPRMPERPVAAGSSLGAFHAILLALRRPESLRGFIALSGAVDTGRFLDGDLSGPAYYASPLAFLPDLHDEAVLGPLRGMEKKVIASGEEDTNLHEVEQVAKHLLDRGVDVAFDRWPGWAHDWPYWKEMMRAYI